MKFAKDLIPWKVTDISIRPLDGYWSFNPSIHFDGQLWRCVLRCCDYAMPGGVAIRSRGARPAGQQTKNVMVILDPGTWVPIQIYQMHERDNLPRAVTPHVGYEDMRLFRTATGGLQGIAASLHLRREGRGDSLLQNQLGAQSQPPEQVLLSFDGEYNIVAARPIRGPGWSGVPQKNWVPFDNCQEARFLYSIGKGVMFGAGGSIQGDGVKVEPSTSGCPVQRLSPLESPSLPTSFERAIDSTQPVGALNENAGDRRPAPRRPNLRAMIRGSDVQIMRGRKMSVDTASVRSSPRPAALRHVMGGDTRMMGAGRVQLPRYEGLRGGTQLSRVAEDGWLGIGHEMKFVGGRKYYWHTWYMVDSMGKMLAVSQPMKLALNGIEFAAGMVINGDQVIVSFGIDDMECKLGETKLSAVMDILQKIHR